METKSKTDNCHCNNNGVPNGNGLDKGPLDLPCANKHLTCSLSASQSKLHHKCSGEVDKSDNNETICNAGSHSSDEKENGLGKDINMITDELVRQKAFKWCLDSLGGAWTMVKSKEELIISPVSGGMSNYLYLISLPPNLRKLDSEPSEVLLRIYGEISKTTMDFLIHNSVVFVLLGEKQLGPRPFGMYHDGRIEEFIKAVPLKHHDLSRQEIMSMVSHKLAHFHTLSMPLCKKPSWFKTLVRGWIEDVEKNRAALAKTLEAIQAMNPSFNSASEFDKLVHLASSLQAPVVFCHNDLQPGNLLYKAASGDHPSELTIIDWEYAHYNHRGFDMANHFNEWMFDYSSSGKPGYKWIPDHFPSKEQQYTFFKSYLSAEGSGEVTQESLDRLYHETNHLVLHSHFFWAFWSLVQALTSAIEFDYAAYALTRFEGYFKHKEKLVELFGSLDV